MKNHYSDFPSEPKFTRYYGLNNFSEAMFLIEAECLDTPAETTTNTGSSQQGILFALGMIATLIVLSFLELYLYRSLTVHLPNPEITKSRELSALDAEPPVGSERKFK